MKKYVLIAAALALPATLLWRPFSARWVLELIPAAEQLEVRVRQTNESNHRFVTRIAGDWRHIGRETTVVLRGGSTQVPGGEIVFHDTTMLPGVFRIRFGDRTLVVQENRVELEDTSAGR